MRFFSAEVKRWRYVTTFALALLLAGQLALHQHSLKPDEGNPALVCAVCAFSSDHVVAATPLAIPLLVIAELVPSVEHVATLAAPLTVTSRGPPQS